MKGAVSREEAVKSKNIGEVICRKNHQDRFEGGCKLLILFLDFLVSAMQPKRRTNSLAQKQGVIPAVPPTSVCPGLSASCLLLQHLSPTILCLTYAALASQHASNLFGKRSQETLIRRVKT